MNVEIWRQALLNKNINYSHSCICFMSEGLYYCMACVVCLLAVSCAENSYCFNPVEIKLGTEYFLEEELCKDIFLRGLSAMNSRCVCHILMRCDQCSGVTCPWMENTCVALLCYELQPVLIWLNWNLRHINYKKTRCAWCITWLNGWLRLLCWQFLIKNPIKSCSHCSAMWCLRFVWIEFCLTYDESSF